MKGDTNDFPGVDLSAYPSVTSTTTTSASAPTPTGVNYKLRKSQGSVPCSRTSFHDPNTEMKASIMLLEARRDFLNRQMNSFKVKHCYGNFGNPAPVVTHPKTADDFFLRRTRELTHEIGHLEELFLQIYNNSSDVSIKNYVAGIRIKKIGQDGDGISIYLAKHFAQLTPVPAEQEPFVSLNKSGVHFYWPRQEDAELFQAVIRAHDIPSLESIKFTRDTEVAQCTDNIVQKRFFSTIIYAISIPHAQVEALFRLAQYHVYTLQPAMRDWYGHESRKLNRCALLIEEAAANKQDWNTQQLSVQAVKAQRISLTDKKDLIEVTVTAQVPASAAVPHVVIVFDDSGSMKDGHPPKITIANQALRDFIDSLARTAPDTLISIQPLNAKTVAHRERADVLKERIKKTPLNIPATGGTPLIETLADTAILLRRHIDDLTIPEEEITCTTIVMMTDGQPTGTYKNARGEDALNIIRGMASGTTFDSNRKYIAGLVEKNYTSYGIAGCASRVTPAIFPIGIGTESDEVFIRDLARALHMPEAFVSDANAAADSKRAFEVMQRMLVRVPHAIIGLHFWDSNIKAWDTVAIEEHNIFHGCNRVVYLRVPAAATNIQLCINMGAVTHLNVCRLAVVTDGQQAQAIRDTYLQDYLRELQSRYSLCTNRDEKHKIENEAQQLSPLTTTLTLSAEIRAFSALSQNFVNTAVTNTTSSSSSNNDALGADFYNFYKRRKELAKYSQMRAIGKHHDVVASHVNHPVFQSICCNQFQEAERLITVDPGLVNVQSVSHHATPLIAAIVQLYELQKKEAAEKTNVVQPREFGAFQHTIDHQLAPAHNWNQPLQFTHTAAIAEAQNFIKYLLTKDNLNLTLQDDQGQTALHRAAWYGFFDTCKQLIQIAIDKKQLEDLKRLQNKVMVGATTGETFLDNIRSSEFLRQPNKEALLRLCGTPLSQELRYFHAQTANELNSHIEPWWNTPIMQILRDLNARSDKKDLMRDYIKARVRTPGVDFLESNFKGDTALHYAIWYGELDIAYFIVQSTPEKNRPLLFAARNSVGRSQHGGGEVPHMNLALIGQRILTRALSANSQDKQSAVTELTKWHDLYKLMLLPQNKKEGDPEDLSRLVEFSHLVQIYISDMQGYNTTTVLRAAPIIECRRLTEHCAAMSVLYPRYESSLRELEKILQNAQYFFSQEAIKAVVDACQQFIDRTDVSIDDPVSCLFVRTCDFFRRVQAYTTGQVVKEYFCPSAQIISTESLTITAENQNTIEKDAALLQAEIFHLLKAGCSDWVNETAYDNQRYEEFNRVWGELNRRITACYTTQGGIWGIVGYIRSLLNDASYKPLLDHQPSGGNPSSLREKLTHWLSRWGTVQSAAINNPVPFSAPPSGFWQQPNSNQNVSSSPSQPYRH